MFLEEVVEMREFPEAEGIGNFRYIPVAVAQENFGLLQNALGNQLEEVAKIKQSRKFDDWMDWVLKSLVVLSLLKGISRKARKDAKKNAKTPPS